MARGINLSTRAQEKAGILQDTEADVRKALAQDSGAQVMNIQEKVINKQRAAMSKRAKAFEHFGFDVALHSRLQQGCPRAFGSPGRRSSRHRGLAKSDGGEAGRLACSLVVPNRPEVPRGVQSALTVRGRPVLHDL